MTKKEKRRASVVFVLVFVLYVSVAMKVEERFSFGRVGTEQAVTPQGMSLITSRPAPAGKDPAAVQSAAAQPAEKAAPRQESKDRPSIRRQAQLDPLAPLAALPLVCFAIKEKKLDREELIPSGKNSRGQQTWKKPEEILKDGDQEGLRNIGRMIGRRTVMDFLEKIDIAAGRDLGPEEVMVGEGFSVETAKLLSAYNRFVTADYGRLFPYARCGQVIVRNQDGFSLSHERYPPGGSEETAAQAWTMPDVTALSMKSAVQRINAHTARIKIYGSGYVVEQQPRPLEKVQGDTECVLYGKTYGR